MHLLLGPTNHLYDELNKVWSGSEAWLHSINVKKVEHHGCIEGNDCRKILKKIGFLEESFPDEYKNFSDTFRLFNVVVNACYGDKLAENYQKVRFHGCVSAIDDICYAKSKCGYVSGGGVL